ncbi:MAG: RpiB/LacA/LacB family sugar-phosphate isomerase [Candidatus Hydrogenedentota bacterium]|nr:MAG: RpiB/LacA/LacB family sugar-phosphate isomerase [Candidatus Hydrogenedentota bacterium]
MKPFYRIALGSDHGGYRHKEILKRFLASLGQEVIDCGCHSEASYDFPLSAAAVARRIVNRTAERGVLIDGAGFPSAMVANRFPGVRAAVVHNDFTCTISRQHSDANVISFGAKVVDPDETCRLVELWLRTDFLGGKYQRRLDLLSAVEREAAGKTSGKRRLLTARDVAENPQALTETDSVLLTPAAVDLLRNR